MKPPIAAPVRETAMNEETSADSLRLNALSVVAENIPAELKATPQWVVWKYFFRDKWTKPPFNAHTGNLAATNDPATWSNYETAEAAYRNGGFDGIGFVLTRATSPGHRPRSLHRPADPRDRSMGDRNC